MAEREMAYAGEVLLQQGVGVFDKFDDARNRDRDVVLHVASGTLLRLAHVLAQQPQCLALG
nr:hypothetical protein [Tanacetum cinerariifolium]